MDAPLRGMVPDVVGVASFSSLQKVSAGLEQILTALDAPERPLLGLKDRWEEDFGVDVTHPSLLSLAGVDIHKKVFLVWRSPLGDTQKAPTEHLLSLPVKSTTQVLGVLTQMLAESQYVRHVDKEGIVHFSGPPGTALLVSVPSADRLLLWLRPQDPNAGAALLANALRHPFSQPFFKAFLRTDVDKSDSVTAANTLVARFEFAASHAHILPWSSLLSLPKSGGLRGEWRIVGNAHTIQTINDFQDDEVKWQERFVPQALPISHCVLEKEALLTLRLPAEAAASLLPGGPSPALTSGLRREQERLSGMLSFYIYGRKKFKPTASLMDLSRFVLVGKPKNPQAASELRTSMTSGAKTNPRIQGSYKMLRLASPQAGRELELVAEADLFAMSFGANGLLAPALSTESASCALRKPGLLLNGNAARSQRWHTYQSPVARLLGQVANGVLQAEVTTSIVENALEMNASILFAP
ncbi:MAG: hypothetical protein GY822_00935 [Deltaproteobacteria bacterium]|nr:hypothetical protein [Deltaproteobacteria bacterium]